MLTEFCTFEDIRLWRRKLEHRNSFSVSLVFSVKVMYSRVFEGSFSVLWAFPVKVMYSWVFQGWFHIPNHHHFIRLFICTVDFPIRDSALRLQPCRTNLFSSMASRMFSKSSRWPRHLPQGKGKKPLRHHRLRRFIKLHYPLQVPPVSGSDHPTRAQGHKRPSQGTHRCKLRIFPILVLRQVRNVLLATRFQSPPTQSHDRPCHHRSNSGKDTKSLLRLHCPRKLASGIWGLWPLP